MFTQKSVVFPGVARNADGTTALNPYIGYAKAAGIAKESVATGRTIIEIAREKGYLSEEQIREILDPARMTEPQRRLDAAKDREKVKSR